MPAGINRLHSRGTCSDLQKGMFVALLWPELRTAQQLIGAHLVFRLERVGVVFLFFFKA